MEYNTTRMAEEYNELLCQAINTIVAANLNELKFDKTIVCTITDISERKNGKYIATDGSITFEAFSDYTNYLKGDQVQVTIPNGDWSAQKTIIGRHSSDTENNPIVHILPTGQIADLTSNIAGSIYNSEFGVIANSDIKLLLVCAFDNLAYDTEVHNTLCVKADFKTILSNYNLQSGAYGLFIKLYTNEGNDLTFNLSSDKDMFGRVYNFQDWVPQEQKFKFSSSIGVVTKIEVFLAQDKNFIHNNDSGEQVQIEPTLTPNIFVRHLNIFLGVDMSTIVDNTVKIYTNDGSKYGKKNNTKTIKLIWYNKGEGNQFLSFNDGSLNEAAKSPSETSNAENYYWIEWFADTKEGYLQYLGEEFDNATQINYTFSDLPMTEVKAIVWLNGVSHESKLQFFNELGDVAGKFDVEYSFTELLGDYKEPNKEVDDDGWYDPNDELPEDKTLNDAIWMATRSSDDGGENWTQWVVTRIRGNDGKDGDSPYLIELTNDSATVGIDVNGNPISLEEATATRVIVYRGSQDITNDCSYTWTAKNGTAFAETGKESALATMSATDTAELTVEVKYTVDNEKTIDIGSKSLTVSKIPSTATYKLVATPQVINMTTSLRSITFKVIKYTKEQSIEFSEPSEDLRIVLSTEDAASEVTITGFLAKINDSFNGATFELQAKKPNTTDEWFTWDRETVSVQRGSQYTSTIFKRSAIGSQVSPPGTHVDEAKQIPVDYFNPLPYGWSDGIPADATDGPLIWMSSAVFENIAGFTPTWSKPVLAMDVEGKFDVQYSYKSEPGDPNNESTPVNDWVDATGNQTIHNALWMATRSRVEGGGWTPWVVTRIKGEDGKSPYTIDLSNDSATIGTDSEGNIPSDAILKEVSETTVTVYLGKEQQTGLSYVWSVTENDELDNYDTDTIYFTKLVNDTGSATVAVKSGNSTIGTKTFTISKNKQGDKGVDAVSYKLVVSPTSWNGTQTPEVTVQFTVIKIQGTDRIELTSGYTIKVGDENKGTISSYLIKDTTTFTLLVNNVIWDAATVDMIKDGEKGDTGVSLEIKYKNDTQTPIITNNDVSGWSDFIPSFEENKNTYMTQKLSNQTNWSNPIQISAAAAPTVEIVNEHWYINGESTGIKATGDTPTITVGANGNWYINGVDSGTKAQGEAGKDGTNIEYVYYRSQTQQDDLNAPSYTNNNLPTGWTTSPQGITETLKYEYVSVRTKPAGTNTQWTSFSKPVIWSKWGEKGQDGDGVEYKYYLSNSSTAPTYPPTTGWTDDPQGVTEQKQYEYVIQIKYTTTNGTTATTVSTPTLWAKWGEQGITGTKTEAVRIYYKTSTTSIPSLGANQTPENADISGAWTLYPVAPNVDSPYVFTSTGVKTTEYADNEGAIKSTIYSSWTTPELFKALGPTGIDQQNYATYLRITNFSTNDGLYYEPIGGVQKLAINATYIKTGTFVVEEGNTTIFSAGWSKNANGQITPSVSMAGWMVDSEKISKNLGGNNQMVLSSEGVLIEENPISGSDDLVDKFVIVAGTNFGVTNTGKLYANGANITGVITATGGKIGDWLIDGSLLKSTNGILTLDGKNGSVSSSSSGNSFSLNDGKLTVKNADIQGRIEADAGNIGDVLIQDGGLRAGTIAAATAEKMIRYTMNAKNATSTTDPHILVRDWMNTSSTIWRNYHYAVITGQTLEISGLTDTAEIAFTDQIPSDYGKYHCYGYKKPGTSTTTMIVPEGATYLIINIGITTPPVVKFTSAAAFSLTGDGKLTARLGEIGGWSVKDEKFMSVNNRLILNAKSGIIEAKNSNNQTFFLVDTGALPDVRIGESGDEKYFTMGIYDTYDYNPKTQKYDINMPRGAIEFTYTANSQLVSTYLYSRGIQTILTDTNSSSTPPAYLTASWASLAALADSAVTYMAATVSSPLTINGTNYYIKNGLICQRNGV